MATSEFKMNKALTMLKKLVEDFEAEVKSIGVPGSYHAFGVESGFADEVLRYTEKTVNNFRSKLLSTTSPWAGQFDEDKHASVVSRLDAIASELEPVNPVLALALDKISDSLDPRT